MLYFSQKLKPILRLGAAVNFPCTTRHCSSLRGQFLPIEVVFVSNCLFVLATEFLKLRIPETQNSFLSVSAFPKISTLENKDSLNCLMHCSLCGSLVLVLTIPILALRSIISFPAEASETGEAKYRQVQCDKQMSFCSGLCHWEFECIKLE